MKIEYPETKKTDQRDEYFGFLVSDPYRWLEDDSSEETSDWVKRQNTVTHDFLSGLPCREKIKNRILDLWNYEKRSAPFIRGKYTYFWKNDGLQNQSVLWRRINIQDQNSKVQDQNSKVQDQRIKGRKQGSQNQEQSVKDLEFQPFLDPNKFSPDGTTSLGEIKFSKDGSKIAYSISEGGQDWRTVFVIDGESGEKTGDILNFVKFSNLAWRGNEGFYYSSYGPPDGSHLTAKTDHHKLYYHKLGTSQDQDQLIFGQNIKRRYIRAYITEDERYLIISTAQSTSGNELYFMDFQALELGIRPIVDDLDNDHSVVYSEGDALFILTNKDAPNYRLIKADIKKVQPIYWQDHILEVDNVLEITTAGDYFFANYTKDAISLIHQFDIKGNFIRAIDLPGIGSATGFSGRKEDKTIYFSFKNYVNPPTIFSLDTEIGKVQLYRRPEMSFDSSSYQSKQVFYKSKDGTFVPMIITHKKGLELNGKNPTLVYGYGGFNVSLLPEFNVGTALWLEMGGIYAVPNIRGGGEYGENWHKAGTQLNKKNVFDDFIGACEYLIDSGYTSSQYLAIKGGSNGGLLVGAVMTQRPDLIRVALPAVGVLDMLRYHKFTSGAGWATDYGTSQDSPDMFKYLYSYSPVHNVKNGQRYPATLITTGDHDDRVVPAHSFKFAALLQECQSQDAPVLIRIETNSGHGAGMSLPRMAQLYADTLSFALANMGLCGD